MKVLYNERDAALYMPCIAAYGKRLGPNLYEIRTSKHTRALCVPSFPPTLGFLPWVKAELEATL